MTAALLVLAGIAVGAVAAIIAGFVLLHLAVGAAIGGKLW